MSYNIINALQRLGAKFQEKDANEEGWIVTNAVYRTDKNPSMGLNINSRSYVDFAGKAPGGSIIDLVVITSKGKDIPKPDTF